MKLKHYPWVLKRQMKQVKNLAANATKILDDFLGDKVDDETNGWTYTACIEVPDSKQQLKLTDDYQVQLTAYIPSDQLPLRRSNDLCGVCH
jgi:hypothetical protein